MDLKSGIATVGLLVVLFLLLCGDESCSSEALHDFAFVQCYRSNQSRVRVQERIKDSVVYYSVILT